MSDLKHFLLVHRGLFSSLLTHTYRAKLSDTMTDVQAPITHEIRMSLLRICLSQSGLGLNLSHSKQIKRSDRKLRHGANAPWNKLGIDLNDLRRSFTKPIESKDLHSLEVCVECESGELVPCLRQRGCWVCIAPQSINQPAHRKLSEPLDITVNSTDLVTVVDSPADNVLELIGFIGGYYYMTFYAS